MSEQGCGWPGVVHTSCPCRSSWQEGGGESPWFSSVVLSCDEQLSWGCEHHEDKGSASSHLFEGTQPAGQGTQGWSSVIGPPLQVKSKYPSAWVKAIGSFCACSLGPAKRWDWPQLAMSARPGTP